MVESHGAQAWQAEDPKGPHPVLTAWWKQRSDPARIELYTRLTFAFLAFVASLAGSTAAVMSTPGWAGKALAVLLVVHAGSVTTLCWQSVDWALEKRRRPTGLLVATAAGMAVLGVAVPLLLADGSMERTRGGVLLASLPLVLGLMALTVNLRSAKWILLLILGVTVAGNVLAFALSLGLAMMAPYTWALLVGGASFTFTSRFSTWMLGVVWELDDARGTQARLAVAEERLRFSRDLHDVLGRDLSVIALKSELAVQLAGRDVDSAVEQMHEVQRIARDSQREVREVVRGYRKTGLQTELAGARGVLSSAGIDCEISTEGVERLSRRVQSALGWVVREGTTNVLRHADAANCAIRLRIDGEREMAVLTLANNGALAKRGSSGPGSGLAGLRERLADLDGSLVAESADDGTFRLVAEVPLGREELESREAATV